MVARHEMPGNIVSVSPSRRVRYDGLAGVSDCPGPWINAGTTNHTVPYGADHVRVFSRHFMLGYHHLVPPGQNLHLPKPVLLANAADRSRRSP